MELPGLEEPHINYKDNIYQDMPVTSMDFLPKMYTEEILQELQQNVSIKEITKESTLTMYPSYLYRMINIQQAIKINSINPTKEKINLLPLLKMFLGN